MPPHSIVLESPSSFVIPNLTQPTAANGVDILRSKAFLETVRSHLYLQKRSGDTQLTSPWTAQPELSSKTVKDAAATRSSQPPSKDSSPSKSPHPTPLPAPPAQKTDGPPREHDIPAPNPEVDAPPLEVAPVNEMEPKLDFGLRLGGPLPTFDFNAGAAP